MNPYQHQTLRRFWQIHYHPDNEKLVHTLNPIPYLEYLYLPKSACLANLKAPNKNFPDAKS